jgi:hypothetical protein
MKGRIGTVITVEGKKKKEEKRRRKRERERKKQERRKKTISEWIIGWKVVNYMSMRDGKIKVNRMRMR